MAISVTGSTSGSQAWTQRFDGPLHAPDQPRAVAITPQSNVVVTGFTTWGFTGGVDIFTILYAGADGTVLWTNRFDGPAHGEDVGEAVAVDAAGNVFITGRSRGATNVFDCYTAKYAATNGALLWEARRLDAAAEAIALDRRGDVVVAGNRTNDGTSGYFVAKYAGTNGALIWEFNTNNYTTASFQALAVDGDDEVVATGISLAFYAEFYQMEHYTVKLAGTNGALRWARRRVNPSSRANVPQAYLALDSQGNVAVAGAAYYTNAWWDMYTAKYSGTNGTLLWEVRYDGSGHIDDAAKAVAVDSVGNVVVTGYSTEGTSEDYSSYTAKYASTDGALLWKRIYHIGQTSHSIFRAVAVDELDDVVLAGIDHGGFGGGWIMTAQYAGMDGTERWRQIYKAPRQQFVDELISSPRCLALGPGGMVAVTGASPGASLTVDTYYDYVTLVYREPLAPLTLTSDGGDGWILRCRGLPGATYGLERATLLAGPNASWETIAAVMVPASGFLEFHETNSPPGQAFYRTALK